MMAIDKTEKRALGQWWARWRTGGTWAPVLVREWSQITDHFFCEGCLMVEWQGVREASREDDPEIEWGDPIRRAAIAGLEGTGRTDG